MQCPTCNTENRENAKFCNECGYEFTSLNSEDISNISVENASTNAYQAAPVDSDAPKLTHIAEKLRASEPSDTSEMLEKTNVSIASDSSSAVYATDADGLLEISNNAGDFYLSSDFSEDFGLSSNTDPLERPSYTSETLQDDFFDDDFADFAEFDEPEFGGGVDSKFIDTEPFDELNSINTAPLSVSDVNYAILEDDQSTLYANAVNAALAQERLAAYKSSYNNYEMPPIPGDAQSTNDSQSYLAFSSNQRRKLSKKTKVGILISLCAVAAISALLGITYAMQIWGGKTIPTVLGTSFADAKYLLEESGFFVEEYPVVSDDVEGIVVEIAPEEGTRQPLGSTVSIGVSTFRRIPDIVGSSLEDAKSKLKEYGYSDFELTTKKSDEEKDTVLAVNPSVGTRANADTRITLEIAEPYLVPDIIGEFKDSAVSMLNEEGLKAEVSYEYSSAGPEGSVIKTIPAAGEPCKSTEAVKVVVAISRATELGDLTASLFVGVNRLYYGGKEYQYVKGSFVNVRCPDDNTIFFTVQAQLYDSHTWPDGRVESWTSNNSYTLEASAGWSNNNQLLYMDPNLLG